MCGVAAGFASQAAAQQVPTAHPVAQPVAEPVPPEYAPRGIPGGTFRFYPVLGLGSYYDDNVYRSSSATKDDFFFSENAGFVLQSQWARHQLDVYGIVRSYQYARLTKESHTDLSVGTDGQLDILRGVDLKGGISYNIHHEQRASPNQPGDARQPTKYQIALADAAFEYHPYHFGIEIGGTFAHYQWSPTPLLGTPFPQNNTDRNRDEYEAYAKLSYDFSPGYSIFTKVTSRTVDYTLTLDRHGQKRNNDGYKVDAGLEANVTRLLVGQIFAGYLDERYPGTLPDITGFNFGANLDWYATPLWTFHLTATRTLNGTTLQYASSEDDQSVRVDADYSMRQDIMLKGYFGYINSDFSGSTPHRADDYYLGGISLNYYMNHNMSAKVAYDYENRASTLPGQGFTDNTVTVGLQFQL
jgi:hypothetical protein